MNLYSTTVYPTPVITLTHTTPLDGAFRVVTDSLLVAQGTSDLSLAPCMLNITICYFTVKKSIIYHNNTRDLCKD